jgi:nitrate reductase (NAD(P)H)
MTPKTQTQGSGLFVQTGYVIMPLVVESADALLSQTESDILMREELDELYGMHGEGRFLMHHTLSQAPETWTQSRGRVSDSLLGQHLPPPSEDGIVLGCGPDPMMNNTIKPALLKLGWDVDRQLVVF